MQFYSQPNICIHRHGRDTWGRFDSTKSDANFPALFCSLQCEKAWIASSLAKLTLADVVDIQARASAAASELQLSAVAGGR